MGFAAFAPASLPGYAARRLMGHGLPHPEMLAVAYAVALLVLGGGYVALEQAQLFARLGSNVTLLVRSRLASKEEPEVSKALQEVFADEGIRVVRRAVPTHVARDDVRGQVVVTADISGGEQEFHAEQVLVALGRRPVTDGLNLDAVEVKTGAAGGDGARAPRLLASGASPKLLSSVAAAPIYHPLFVKSSLIRPVFAQVEGVAAQ